MPVARLGRRPVQHYVNVPNRLRRQWAAIPPAGTLELDVERVEGVGAELLEPDRAEPGMHRRLRSETCERFREPDAAGSAPIREALERWATPETLATLAAAQPVLPGILNDRAQDGWEPLLAIADLADGGWPGMARAAAAALQAGAGDATDEALELLALRHVRDAFEESGERKLRPQRSSERSCIETTVLGRNGGRVRSRRARNFPRRGGWDGCSNPSALNPRASD